MQKMLPTSLVQEKSKLPVNPPWDVSVTVKFEEPHVEIVADAGVIDATTFPTVTCTVAECTNEPI